MRRWPVPATTFLCTPGMSSTIPVPSAETEPVRPEGPVPPFRSSPTFSVGLEDELLLVDPSTLMLTAADPGRLRQLRGMTQDAGTVAGEVSAAEIELITPVCQTVGDAIACLRRLRTAVRAAENPVIAAGVHPAGAFADLRPARSARYERVMDELGGLLRTPTAALHVHVGMPDGEAAIRAHNALRRRLPLLQALSAGSPFWHGRDSRLASARAAILRSYPRAGIPPAFADYDDFTAVTTEVANAAGVSDYTYFWWDVRPHPRLGTIEVRAMDSQWSVERIAALTVLIYGFARHGVESPGGRQPSHEALSQCHFQAARHGVRARLLDDDGHLRPVPELARDAVGQLRPFLAELGGAADLDRLQDVLCIDEPRRQRALHGTGGMDGLLHDLAARTLEGD